jgi:hypothetical protein
LLQSRQIAAEQNDLRTGLGQGLRNGQADTATSASDDGGTLVQGRRQGRRHGR